MDMNTDVYAHEGRGYEFGGSEGVWVDKYVSWGRPKSKIADK